MSDTIIIAEGVNDAFARGDEAAEWLQPCRTEIDDEIEAVQAVRFARLLKVHVERGDVMSVRMPNGKTLAECTFEEVGEIGEWMKAVGERIAVMQEKELAMQEKEIAKQEKENARLKQELARLTTDTERRIAEMRQLGAHDLASHFEVELYGTAKGPSHPGGDRP